MTVSMRPFLLLLSLFLASCSWLTPYKIDVQQGNYLTQEMVAKLKPGMTKSQVRFALGTPLVTDAFHANRWDYFYSYSKNGELIERRKITAVFDKDVFTQVVGDVATLPSQPITQPSAEVAKPPEKDKAL